MTESIHDQVVAGLLATPRDQWQAIADAADVALPTLAKIAYRQIDEPGVNKAERILRVLIARRPLVNSQSAAAA